MKPQKESQSVLASESTAPSTFNVVNGIDFSAPVTIDRSNLGDVTVGTIVFDTNQGAFYGLAPSAVGSTTPNWVLMGSTTGGPRSELWPLGNCVQRGGRLKEN